MTTTLQIIFRKLYIYIYIHYMYISAPKRQKSWNPGNEKTSFWKMQVLERCFDGIFSVLPGLCIRGCAGPVRNSPMRIDQQQTGSISYRKMSLGQQKKPCLCSNMNKMVDLVFVWIEDDLWSWNLFIPIEHVQFVLNGEKLQRRTRLNCERSSPRKACTMETLWK